MKCPHCFLELIITPLYDKEVDKCPKCEGIWLDKNDSEYTFDFTDEGGDKDNMTYQDFQSKKNSNDENVDNKLEYYYYKKPFKENGKIDDMFDFE
jgi:uncharacterized protein